MLWSHSSRIIPEYLELDSTIQGVKMDELLKGNYKIKKQIIDDDKNKKNVREEKAKASIGGSMVFIETKQLVWKGDEDESKLKQPKT